jgi:hypothetical protein
MIARLRWFYLLLRRCWNVPLLSRGVSARPGISGEQIGAVTFAQQAVAAPARLIWIVRSVWQRRPLYAFAAAFELLPLLLLLLPLSSGQSSA